MFDDVDDVLPIFLKLKRDILTTLDLPYDTFWLFYFLCIEMSVSLLRGFMLPVLEF